jgi:hypothetical protein
VLDVVFDIAVKIDVVGVLNCETIVVGIPNAGIVLLLIVLKFVAVVVTDVETTLGLEAPKRNRDLLLDEVVEVTEVPNGNVDVIGNPKAGITVVVGIAVIIGIVVVVDIAAVIGIVVVVAIVVVIGIVVVAFALNEVPALIDVEMLDG